MILEDLDDFMKRNGIDTDTKERSSKEKIGRLQGMVSSPKDDKDMFEHPFRIRRDAKEQITENYL